MENGFVRRIRIYTSHTSANAQFKDFTTQTRTPTSGLTSPFSSRFRDFAPTRYSNVLSTHLVPNSLAPASNLDVNYPKENSSTNKSSPPRQSCDLLQCTYPLLSRPAWMTLQFTHLPSLPLKILSHSIIENIEHIFKYSHIHSLITI